MLHRLKVSISLLVLDLDLVLVPRQQPSSGLNKQDSGLRRFLGLKKIIIITRWP